MVVLNKSKQEINCKIVYYGPGLGGKTTSLEFIFRKLDPKKRGEMISLATESDRTLFFDFLPIEVGKIKGYDTRFHLYTVPGQVFYNASRKLILKGVDGIIFVADSQEAQKESNLESWQNLKNNISSIGIDPRHLPLVVQYNKRDLPNAMSIAALEELINEFKAPYFETTATTGVGILEALKHLSKTILTNLQETTLADE